MSEPCQWLDLGNVSSFSRGKMVVREVDTVRLIIFRGDSEWFAFQEKCPHALLPLGDGDIHDLNLACAWHRMVFRLQDGIIIDDAGFFGVPGLVTYPVRVVDGVVQISL